MYYTTVSYHIISWHIVLLLLILRGCLGYYVYGVQAIFEFFLQHAIDHTVALHRQLARKSVRNDKDTKVCLQESRLAHGLMLSVHGAFVNYLQVGGLEGLFKLQLDGAINMIWQLHIRPWWVLWAIQ